MPKHPFSARLPAQPLALRVALVREGRIVLEQTLARGEVSFDGETLSEAPTPEALATFSFAGGSLAGGEVTLRTTLAGRMRGPTEETVIEGPSSEKRLVLHDRGRLEHRHAGGRVTLLFQVVECAPQRKPPGLPASMQRGATVDGRFTAISLASLLAHFAFVMVLEQMDPTYVAAALPPARIVELMMDAPTPPPPAPIEPTSLEPTEPTEVAEAHPIHESDRPSSTPSSTNPSSRTSGPREALDTARIGVELDRLLGPSAIGSLGPELSGPSPTFATVTGVMEASPTASPSSTLGPRSGGGPVSTTGLGVLALAGGGTGPRSEGSDLVETGPRGTVRPEPISDLPSAGVFDVVRVSRVVQRQLGAIRRCYERELRDDPSVHGSMEISFTIEESGTVSGVHPTDDTTHSDRLGECVSRVFRALPRFTPGPEGGSVRFSYPLVFVPGE